MLGAALVVCFWRGLAVPLGFVFCRPLAVFSPKMSLTICRLGHPDMSNNDY